MAQSQEKLALCQQQAEAHGFTEAYQHEFENNKNEVCHRCVAGVMQERYSQVVEEWCLYIQIYIHVSIYINRTPESW